MLISVGGQSDDEMDADVRVAKARAIVVSRVRIVDIAMKVICFEVLL